MKKTVTFLILFFAPSLIFSCQVIFINDSGRSVLVHDLNAGKKQRVKAGTLVDANVDPKTHARLLINIGPTSYLVKQYACAETREIPLKTSDIVRLNGGKLLTITKEK